MNATDEEMLSQTLKVEEVDAVEIFSLVDNSVDFLSTIGKNEVQSFRQWTKERHKGNKLLVCKRLYVLIARVFVLLIYMRCYMFSVEASTIFLISAFRVSGRPSMPTSMKPRMISETAWSRDSFRVMR